MFNLEQAMMDWRRNMLAAGITDPNVLEELKGHLRDDVAALMKRGKTESEAFELAMVRLGKPASVRAEFGKVRGTGYWTVMMGSLLWVGGLAAMAAVSAGRIFAGKLHFLLAAHIVTFTAGYGAVFLLGLFGISSVCTRREPMVDRAVYWFSHLAAGLVIAGILLGLPVSQDYFGRYWRWDPKEIGALCVVAWLVALVARQRFVQACDRTTLLMCIGGNIVVSLAWFGAGMIDYNQRMHRHGGGIPWLLITFVAMNACFVVAGLRRQREAAES